jgi:hypothetical protein
MQYRPDILTLYGQLFKDAHEEMSKEAGIFSRIGRFFTAPRRARMAEEALAKAEGQAARHEQAISDAAHRMGQMEFDVAASRAAQQKAEQQAAQYAKEMGELGAKPGQLGRYKALAAGGLGLGALGAVGAPLAYGAGKSQGEADKKRTRNIAFGAGAAAGLAAPQLVRGLGQVARGVSRTGLYPELEGVGGY